jgi:broad specificity phosphatase PhoE
MTITGPGPCRVFLTRHGEAAMPDEQGRILNYSDAPLTDRGRTQARDVGRLLEKVPVDAIFSSDLARARQTAEEIAGDRDIPVVVKPALREVDIGAFEGISLPELRGIHPQFIPWLEIAFAGRFPSADFCIPADLSFPGGESVEEMFRRVKPAFLEIAREWQGRTVVVVSHAWLTQSLICHVTGTDLHSYFRFAGANAVLTMAEVNPLGEGLLHVLNGNADLPTVSGGRVRPSDRGLEDGRQGWSAAARLGAGQERVVNDLSSTTRLWLIGHGEKGSAGDGSGDGRVPERLTDGERSRARRLAERLMEYPIEAVHAADLERSVESASEVAAGRPMDVRVEPGLLDGGDAPIGTFHRIVGDGLGRTIALVAPGRVVQQLICRIVASDPSCGTRFPITFGTVTLVEVGEDGRGVLEMLNGRWDVEEVAGGRLLPASGHVDP